MKFIVSAVPAQHSQLEIQPIRAQFSHLTWTYQSQLRWETVEMGIYAAAWSKWLIYTCLIINEWGTVGEKQIYGNCPLSLPWQWHTMMYLWLCVREIHFLALSFFINFFNLIFKFYLNYYNFSFISITKNVFYLFRQNRVYNIYIYIYIYMTIYQLLGITWK